MPKWDLLVNWGAVGTKVVPKAQRIFSQDLIKA